MHRSYSLFRRQNEKSKAFTQSQRHWPSQMRRASATTGRNDIHWLWHRRQWWSIGAGSWVFHRPRCLFWLVRPSYGGPAAIGFATMRFEYNRNAQPVWAARSYKGMYRVWIVKNLWNLPVQWIRKEKRNEHFQNGGNEKQEKMKVYSTGRVSVVYVNSIPAPM